MRSLAGHRGSLPHLSMEPTVTEAPMAGARRVKTIVEGADRRWVFAGPGDVPVASVLRL